MPPYGQPPEERQAGLLEILKEELGLRLPAARRLQELYPALAFGLSFRQPGCRSAFSACGNFEGQSSAVLG